MGVLLRWTIGRSLWRLHHLVNLEAALLFNKHESNLLVSSCSDSPNFANDSLTTALQLEHAGFRSFGVGQVTTTQDLQFQWLKSSARVDSSGDYCLAGFSNGKQPRKQQNAYKWLKKRVHTEISSVTHTHSPTSKHSSSSTLATGTAKACRNF